MIISKFLFCVYFVPQNSGQWSVVYRWDEEAKGKILWRFYSVLFAKILPRM
jgi:hypothetical protein